MSVKPNMELRHFTMRMESGYTLHVYGDRFPLPLMFIQKKMYITSWTLELLWEKEKIKSWGCLDGKTWLYDLSFRL